MRHIGRGGEQGFCVGSIKRPVGGAVPCWSDPVLSVAARAGAGGLSSASPTILRGAELSFFFPRSTPKSISPNLELDECRVGTNNGSRESHGSRTRQAHDSVASQSESRKVLHTPSTKAQG